MELSETSRRPPWVLSWHERERTPELNYLWWVISSLKNENTRTPLENVRKSRSYEARENNDDLVEIDARIIKEIEAVYWQKGMTCGS